MSTFRRIYRDDIHAHLQAGTPIKLVEALPEKYYREGHLPSAIQIPHEEVRERAEALLPDKNEFIVVYCANTPCRNSRVAAQTLASMGYTRVAEYEEGKQDWIDAGLPVEKDQEAA
ncbi:MAG: rhodanese-like domain-containing protein [Gammaproteobacteria bacterium]|jgi:rhodanese-related sulfurtransferase